MGCPHAKNVGEAGHPFSATLHDSKKPFPSQLAALVPPIQQAIGTSSSISAGGGGKGMKMVKRVDDLKMIFGVASAEARAAFGDDRIYIEHLIPNARHIEIQILADRLGNVVHLFERDCSLQRRCLKQIFDHLRAGLRI